MTALAGEIRYFLTERGIDCVAEVRCGAGVLGAVLILGSALYSKLPEKKKA